MIEGQKFPPPASYTCRRCKQKGHWIQFCPLNKKSTLSLSPFSLDTHLQAPPFLPTPPKSSAPPARNGSFRRPRSRSTSLSTRNARIPAAPSPPSRRFCATTSPSTTTPAKTKSRPLSSSSFPKSTLPRFSMTNQIPLRRHDRKLPRRNPQVEALNRWHVDGGKSASEDTPRRETSRKNRPRGRTSRTRAASSNPPKSAAPRGFHRAWRGRRRFPPWFRFK